MNLSLVDPFVIPQDYPETTTASLRNGHTTYVRFNHQGDLLAAARLDGTVVIWDVETLGVAKKLRGHLRQVYSLAWSKSDRYLLSAGNDWQAWIWDLQTGENIRTVNCGGPVYMADFHPSNQ